MVIAAGRSLLPWLVKLAEHQEGRAHAYVKISEAHRRIGVAGEVDGHRTFDRRRHGPIATLPGRAGRTVTAVSVGKMFSATGRNV